MSESKAQAIKARHWFDAGADVLPRLYTQLPPDHYACPQCTRMFSRDQLADGCLTLEHVPPASIGGRRMVLTCKSCNSTSGARFDAHLATANTQRRFLIDDNVRPLDVNILVDGLRGRARASLVGGEIVIHAHERQNNPTDIEALATAIDRKVENGGVVEMELRGGFRQRPVMLSYLRSAYLTAFAHFGYSYVFQRTLDRVRRALNGHDDGDGFLGVLPRPPGADGERALLLVASPAWLAGCVMVLIDRIAIVLPSVGTNVDPVSELIAHEFHLPTGLTASAEFPWPTAPAHCVDRWRVAQHSDSPDP